MSIHDDIQRAGKALSDAQIQLADALKAAYPVGAVLRVGLGNAKVNVRVTRHARAPGNRPGELSGLNVNTGKYQMVGE